MPNNEPLVAAFTEEAVACLQYGGNKIRHCLAQLNDDQVWWRPREEMNSIGNLLLHLAGNVRQWIVAGVGDETDNRDRQSEFDQRGPRPKEEALEKLETVLEQAESVMRSVTSDELLKAKRIQGHDTTKMGAIWHSITHFQGHVQEIIGLTRQQLGDEYEFEWSPSTAEEGAS